MSIKKIRAKSPNRNLSRPSSNATFARLADVNQLVDQINNNTPAVPSSSYKIYTALISQSGTDAPTLVVLENTLGITLTWTYGSTGYYYSDNISADVNKTTVSCTPGSNAPVGYSISPAVNFNGLTINFSINTSANYAGGPVPGPGPFNGLLNRSLFEIRVYN